MEPGIENFAGVIIQNSDEEILLVRKVIHYAYAIPWCRIVPGRRLEDCLRERVMDLIGLSIQPVFLGPSEHIEGNSHFISFDHIARVDAGRHHYTRRDLDYLWAGPGDLMKTPLVPLTRQILERYYLDRGIEPELSSEPKKFDSGS